jgi:hypothetical protein
LVVEERGRFCARTHNWGDAPRVCVFEAAALCFFRAPRLRLFVCVRV